MVSVFRGSQLAPILGLALAGSSCVVDEPLPEPFDDEDDDDDDDATAPLLDDDDSSAEDCAVDSYDWGQGGEWMLPGAACLSCHTEDGHAESGFSAGGTVFVSPTCPEPLPGVVIHIWDANRRWFRLTTNEVGNFWTADDVTVPVRIALEVDGELYWKPGLQPSLACNTCHSLGAPAGLISPD